MLCYGLFQEVIFTVLISVLTVHQGLRSGFLLFQVVALVRLPHLLEESRFHNILRSLSQTCLLHAC